MVTPQTPLAPNPDDFPAEPSVAYDQVLDSPVYRLSELMFGSLLAAYVLGFIGILAGRSLTSEGDSTWAWVLLAVKYTSISVAYAYLTAAVYVQYHAGILTMHHMRLGRLGFDFLFALAQAVSFGFSLIFPESFTTLLGGILLAAFFRQRREFKRLARSLYDASDRRAHAGGRNREEMEKTFRRDFVKLLNKRASAEDPTGVYSELSVWKPAGWWLLLMAVLLLIGGAVVWYLVDIQRLPSFLKSSESWHLDGRWLVAQCGAVAFVVFLYGHLTLLRRATFLYNRRNQTTKMDEQFGDLCRELGVHVRAKSNT